jgi:glycosyltransferase involved in cell wall biosynthesis
MDHAVLSIALGLVRGHSRDTVTSEKRLLAISWEMPPLSGPRAVQVTRTLAALPEFGWRSRVICFGPRSNRYHQDHRVSLDALSDGHASLLPVASPEEWFVFRALWRVAPPLKHFPDEKRVWMPAALEAARRTLAAAPADVIVSFAQPWTDHLIGLRLHRETRLPLVAHFSDPWVDSPYFHRGGLVRRKAETWEREVVEAAARVVFVNAQTRDRVMAKYPVSWKAKSAVIPQSYEPDAGAPAPSPIASNRPMRMVYTGRFYDGIRTPDALLRALGKLHRESSLDGRLEVEFVGADMNAYARQADSLGLRTVRFSGRVPPADARARAATADVLLVIDADSDVSLFLPSKLIEYLPLRRPILGLTPVSGPSSDLIRELGYRVVSPGDVTAIAAALRELLQAHAAGRLVPSLQHDSVAERFSVARTTRKFAGVLDHAVGAR